MRKIFSPIFMGALILFSFDGAGIAQTSQELIELPNSTIVAVKSANRTDSESVALGQEVVLYVALDVVVRGKVLIAAGAPVISTVEQVREKGMVGVKGRISLTFQSTQAVDGTTVALTGSMRAQGDDQMGGTIAVGVILCPLALLNKGGTAVIAPGAQARAITNGSFSIRPLSSSEERIMRDRLEREGQDREEQEEST